MHDFLPITLNSLKADTRIGCDIYLLIRNNGTSRYILYCKNDAAFDNEQKEMLVRKNINKLFIGKEDQQKYSEYLESNLKNILSDDRIESKEKAQIVYGTATNMLRDVFNAPRFKNLERSKTFAYNMIDYILRDGKAAYNLLKITSHDYYTYTHSVNVATIGSLFAKNIGLGEKDMKTFCTGMLLHDLGKTKIHSDILNKKGTLTDDEFKEMRKHPEMGVAVLRESGDSFNEEYSIILQHHENCDGSGYPFGLKKEEIHYSSRIVRIIDIYDALTTQRSYSAPQKPYNSLKVIRDEMYHAVDHTMLKSFIKFLGGHGSS
ncbi:MAG: HD domain-containing protein [Candidatus Scalindua sp.]|nr:HD domain-containing protein [Candidatus Scalindua sp.]MCR4344513.1 HD domain-containing protein [Candidatus Scalindua sp.]